MKDLINSIIDEEWAQFQAVNNRGGRASCQDNYKEFHVMRYSQFATWSETLLRSYQKDLLEAKSNNRNLLFEKYGYMMKDTFPDEYKQIAHALPKLSNEKIFLIKKISKAYLDWAKDFADEYPHFSSMGRSIYQDNTQFTSIETYLKGELSTYSEATLNIYWNYVSECVQSDINLVTRTREITAKCYGYSSIEEVEKL